MKTSEAVQHFGSQHALAKALSLSQPSVAKWKDYPPALRQLQIEAVTTGALRAEADCDKFRVPAQKVAA